jgi:alcohol dehydrogenase/L-iditol 2-dehydrogenase
MGLRGGPVTLPFDEICFKELRVRSGFASNPTAWLRAMGLLETGAIQLEPLISGAAELADFESAFARSRAGDGVKLVLVP